MSILPQVKRGPSLTKTLPVVSALSAKMKTGFRKDRGGGGREDSSNPSPSAPAHLPQVDKADNDPDKWQPQPVQVDDALRQPLHVHGHQVHHVPHRAGLSGAAGQSQDLGGAGGTRPELEGRMGRGAGTEVHGVG